MDNWIDVKEDLPRLDVCVIVATKNNVFPAVRIRKDGSQFWTNATWNYIPMEDYTGKVLYWQPLPEHPRKMKGD